jgi:hypothetical protein
MADDPEPEDEPLSPEEEAESQAFREACELELEAKATQLYGPPEVRERKCRRYAGRLVKRFGEPVIRGLLIALSRLDRPLCAQWLSEMDLAAAPLALIIRHYDLMGPRFRILSIDGDDYVVDISGGFGTAGDGGVFLIGRDFESDGFKVKGCLLSRIS